MPVDAPEIIEVDDTRVACDGGGGALGHGGRRATWSWRGARRERWAGAHGAGPELAGARLLGGAGLRQGGTETASRLSDPLCGSKVSEYD